MKKLKEKKEKRKKEKEKEVFLWPNFSTKTLQYCVNYQSWLLISSDMLKTKAWTYFGIASSTFTTSAVPLLIWDFFNTSYVFMVYVSSENDSFDSLTHNSSRICAY